MLFERAFVECQTAKLWTFYEPVLVRLDKGVELRFTASSVRFYAVKLKVFQNFNALSCWWGSCIFEQQASVGYATLCPLLLSVALIACAFVDINNDMNGQCAVFVMTQIFQKRMKILWHLNACITRPLWLPYVTFAQFRSWRKKVCDWKRLVSSYFTSRKFLNELRYSS